MNIASYCKKAGMNLAQFIEYEERSAQLADRLMEMIKKNPLCGKGVYQFTSDLLFGIKFREDIPEREHLIMLLKERGVEFYDNGSCYRF